MALVDWSIIDSGLTRRRLVAAFTPASLSGLVSWWKLEEASGTRVDSFGSNNLTDNNTVTQATGQVGNAAQFTGANSEYLNISDNAGLSTGDVDFSVAAGIRFDSLTQTPVLIGKGATDQYEWSLQYASIPEKLRFALYNATASQQDSCDWSAAIDNSIWYFVILWHNTTDDTLNLSVDDGTPVTISRTVTLTDGTADFQLGRLATGNYYSGRLDEVFFAKAVWSAAERTNLYNWWVAGGV